jgi:type I restriction-modification system DNA methylase subunit
LLITIYALNSINIIETSDKNNQAAIVEYLINKTEITAQNGQIYLPEHIARLIVATSDPRSKDIIIDPSVGNGSLLVHTAKYMANNSNSFNPEFNVEKTVEMLKGIDSDLVQLRIAGLNLILHGIKNPELETFSSTSNNIFKTDQTPTLFISNLYFEEPENKLPGVVNSGQTDHSRKDVFFLDLILKSLKPGGRVAVLVPEFFLFSNDAVISNIRHKIVDNNKLEGVISLPAKSNAPLSGAGILIFNKHESITSENVWFFRMKARKEQVGKNEQNFSEADEASDMLYKWNNRKVTPVNDPNHSFYVTAYDIKTNNYILSFNDYKIIAKKRELKKNAENNIAAQENRIVPASEKNQDHNFEENFLSEEKKPKRKIHTAVIVLVALATTASGIYYYNFKNSTSAFANSNEVIDSISNKNVVTKASPVKELGDSSIRSGSLNSTPADSKGYSVISKAYFYSEPDERKRRSLYLLHRNDYVLPSTVEQNGFVYIVYVNKNGETTKGWINKKDLQPIQ